MSPMLIGRTCASAFVLGQYIYMVGGLVKEKKTPSVERYDLSQDRWQHMTDLPYGVDNAAACVMGDAAYLSGGALSRNEASCEVLMYNLELDSWQVKTRMRAARMDHGMCCDLQQLYIVGGCSIRLIMTSSMDCYNPETDQWTQLAPLPKCRLCRHVIYHQNLIIVVGGFGQSRTQEKHIGATDTILIYDVREDKWQESLTTLPQKITDHECALLILPK